MAATRVVPSLGRNRTAVCAAGGRCRGLGASQKWGRSILRCRHEQQQAGSGPARSRSASEAGGRDAKCRRCRRRVRTMMPSVIKARKPIEISKGCQGKSSPA